MSQKPQQQWKINHIWKGVNDLALRVDKDRDDLTILVKLDQVTFKTLFLLLWKKIIDKYSEKQEQSITCLHLYQC